MDGKLRKPVFVKVESLTDCRDGYNVYVTVVSAEHEASQKGDQNFVRAVVADETGFANAFFKGDTAKLIQKDQVIAIRNGRVKLIKSHISLEVDIFGRVTKENVEIKANTEKNISQKEVNRPRRKPRNEDRPRREEGDRKPRREEGERQPRRDDGDRKPRREEGDWKPRREEGERQPRRDDGDRKPRREEGERQPRRQGDRPPRREEGERKPRREEGDRPPRRDDGDRKPRREGDDRPKMEWTKIGAVEPGDERLNITAKVISAQVVKNKVRVVLGDETGIIKAFLYNDDAIKEGSTVVVFKAEAAVVKEHIEIQLMKGGRVEESRTKKINEVDESVNISAKAWVESA